MKRKSTNNARIAHIFVIIVFALIFLRQSFEAIRKYLEMNTSFHVHLEVMYCEIKNAFLLEISIIHRKKTL